jgi:hypothetical protein
MVTVLQMIQEGTILIIEVIAPRIRDTMAAVLVIHQPEEGVQPLLRVLGDNMSSSKR